MENWTISMATPMGTLPVEVTVSRSRRGDQHSTTLPTAAVSHLTPPHPIKPTQSLVTVTDIKQLVTAKTGGRLPPDRQIIKLNERLIDDFGPIDARQPRLETPLDAHAHVHPERQVSRQVPDRGQDARTLESAPDGAEPAKRRAPRQGAPDGLAAGERDPPRGSPREGPERPRDQTQMDARGERARGRGSR